MSVGYRANNTSSIAAALSASTTRPTAAQDGDVQIVAINISPATTITQSSGATFTQIGTTQTWAGGTRSSALFYRRFTGTDATTFSFGATATGHIATAVYRNVDPTTPIENFAFDNESDASDTSVPIPSLTTTAQSRVVAIGHAAGQTLTTPTGFISRTTSSTNGNTNMVDSGPDAAAGTLGPWSFTITAAQHAAWTVALKADPARPEAAWELSAVQTATANLVTPVDTGMALKNGDLMAFLILLSSTTASVNSVPSGWTLIDSTFSGQARLYSYWKIYDGTLGDFGFSASVPYRIVTLRFTSVNNSSPIGGVNENSGLAGTTVTFPSVTPTANGHILYLGASSIAAAGTNAATLPTGATSRFGSSTSDAAGSTHAWGGQQANATSGVATTSFTSTLTNAWDWAAHTVIVAHPSIATRWAPDAILSQTNLGGFVADIDDDPDTPDTAWLISHIT